MEYPQRDKYQIIYDMGHGLLIVKVSLSDLKEQDVNARLMKDTMQEQLTANIKSRGQLESLPFLTLCHDTLEIISGHHRIKSAKSAGLKEIIAILDISGLNRSQIAAKQLAHNAISGFDDESTIKEIVKMILDVDDMIESYIGKEYIEEPLAQLEKLQSPSVQFDFKNVTFTFLPHQINDINALIESLSASLPDVIGIAAYDQCEGFITALEKYQKFTDIRNIGAAIHSMVEAVNEQMNLANFNLDSDWTYLTKIFGCNAIPSDSSEIMKLAVKKAMKERIVTSKNKWQLIEYLAADYMSGR